MIEACGQAYNRRMRSLKFGAVLLFAAPNPKDDHAKDNCGILYGKFHTLTYCAPDGWLMNNRIMNQEGIYAVLYRNGSNWHEAQFSGTFMYINVIGKKPGATVDTQIAHDAADVKKREPKAVI
jgi:hypothetical protein